MSSRLPLKSTNLGKLSPSWRITPLSPPTTHLTLGKPATSSDGIPGHPGSGTPIPTLSNSGTTDSTTSGGTNVNTTHGTPAGPTTSDPAIPSPATSTDTFITTLPSTALPPLSATSRISGASTTNVPPPITNPLALARGSALPPVLTIQGSAFSVTSIGSPTPPALATTAPIQPPTTISDARSSNTTEVPDRTNEGGSSPTDAPSGSATVGEGWHVRADAPSNGSIPSITLVTASGTAIKDFGGFDDREILIPVLQKLASGLRNNLEGLIGVADNSVTANNLSSVNDGESKPLTSISDEATNVIGGPSFTNEHSFAPWYKYACADVLLSLDPITDFESWSEGPSSNSTQTVLNKWENFWDNGSTITYAFMESSLIQQRKVVAVFRQWSRYANIKFEYRENLYEATIRISFEERFGSFSYIGRTIESVPTDRATMNLGWLEDVLVFTDLERAVLLHEVGHALGLSHEHASAALGGQGTLKQDAYENYNNYVVGGAHEALVAGAFYAYINFELSNYLETDAESIMKYFMPQEMNEESMQVLPNYGLSDMDLAFIMIAYPFPPGSVPVKDGWDFNHALWVAGVEGDVRERILEEYANSNWPEIRFQFINYYTEARAAFSHHGVRDNESLPDESVQLDWCCAEDASTGDGDSNSLASVNKDLWLPGDKITYSFVQGTNHATPYRQRRIAETYAYYSSVTNLKFEEIPFDPVALNADVHIYFGPIPNGRSLGWSEIGTACQASRQSQALIDQRGGTVESSMCFTDVVPRTEDLITNIGNRVQEERALFHEIAHSLGLKHERLSTVTADTLDGSDSVATPVDFKSIMLYTMMDKAFLGVLYPYPNGHMSDHFEADIRKLGLQLSFAKLSAQRDRAFSFTGHPEFAVEIGQLRRMIHNALANLAASPPFSSLSDPSFPSATIAQSVRTTPPVIDKPFFKAKEVMPPKAMTGPFIRTIIDELTKLFAPSSGQAFALQLPGRFLSQNQFAWDTTAFGQLIKPTTVIESEFRLTDQLYNVGNVVGAPNGRSLSIAYERCLNNLVPGPQQTAIARRQDRVRKWLMKEVPTTGWVKDLISSQQTQPKVSDAPVSSSTPRALRAASAPSPPSVNSLKSAFAVSNKLTEKGSVNRMELADALMIEYLTAKQAWELERDELILAVKAENTDAATRHLAHITSIREGQLAAKYADAVVRGYSHTVRQYLGYLDIKGAAESLQDVKDALHNSASSSLDGSVKVYPVQMQPIDWFQGLSTNFTVEDLFMNPDVIQQQLDAKSKQLDILHTQLALMQPNPTTGFEELQGAIDAAQSMYTKAQVELYTTYTSNVTSLAKTCTNAGGEFVMNDFVKLAKASEIADVAFVNIEQAMAKITSAQLAITQASRAYAHLLSATSLVQAAETTKKTAKMTTDISALTREVDQLTSQLRALRFNNATATTAMGSTKIASVNEIDLLPKETTSGGSRWQEITMTHTIDHAFPTDSSFSEAGTSKEDCSFFFGSYEPGSFLASEEDSSLSRNSSVSVHMGFRCTLVTVDRGGWFQPQFFKQSNGFCHVDEKVSWSKWPQDIKTTDDLKGKGLRGAFDAINNYLMPAFPTGFLIAKDITIKVLQTSAEVQSSAADFEKAAASAAGILCWSTNVSHHDRSSENACAYAQADDGCVIRIPGPQIMGYMLQFTDPDMTEPLPDDLTEGFLSSDDEYDAYSRKRRPLS